MGVEEYQLGSFEGIPVISRHNGIGAHIPDTAIIDGLAYRKEGKGVIGIYSVPHGALSQDHNLPAFVISLRRTSSAVNADQLKKEKPLIYRALFPHHLQPAV